MIMANALYDVLNKLQRWLPAIGVFYLTIANIWELPFGDQVNKTVVAVATLLAAFLEVSNSQYNKKMIGGAHEKH